ncbi:sugar ABC transporter substrate-binding protein [Streptomyces wedmorensis]
MLAAGCSNDGSSSSGSASASPTRAIKVAYVTSGVNGWIQANADSLRRGAGVPDVTMFNADFDPAKLTAQLQSIAASKQYDAVAVVPVTGVSVPAIKSVIDAGVKVATVLVPATNPVSNQLVPGAVIATGEPYERTGRSVGALTVEACKGVDPCNVGLIIGSRALPADQTFARGFEAAIKNSETIRLVATGEGRFDAQAARATAQSMLQAHGDLKVLATEADNMTGGAELAVEGAGKTSTIALIGHGASVQGCQAVKSGAWFGTTVSLPRTNGEIAGKALREAVLNGKQPADPTPDPVGDFPGGQSITRQNADKCPAQWSQ